MSKLRLWLDDIREMPEKFNKHVCSAPEAIEAIVQANGKIKKVSLDHDLGEYEGTGYDVALFIEESAFEGVLEPFNIYIHTANPVARKRMFDAASNAARFWKEKTGKEVKVEIVIPKPYSADQIRVLNFPRLY